MSKTTVRTWMTIALASLALGGAADASAHTLNFYPWYYPSGTDNIPLYFDDDFPTGRARDRVADGAQQWNDLGRRFYFRVSKTPSVSSSADTAPNGLEARCPTPQRDGRRVGLAHWGAIDGRGDTIAQVGLCWRNRTGGRHMESFRMYFDRTEQWYAGRGDSRVRNRRTGAVENRHDVWSVATHELGHATGWLGHWRASGSFCSYSEHPGRMRTMCPFVAPGFERARTLAAADKHVFNSRYSAR